VISVGELFWKSQTIKVCCRVGNDNELVCLSDAERLIVGRLEKRPPEATRRDSGELNSGCDTSDGAAIGAKKSCHRMGCLRSGSARFLKKWFSSRSGEMQHPASNLRHPGSYSLLLGGQVCECGWLLTCLLLRLRGAFL